MGKKKVKVQKGVKRLFDLEIDEVSLVDKPAIGEEFYVTKRVNDNKGNNMTKPVKKGVAWKESVKKNASENNTHCVFCGITKEEEAESMGMGLIKGVCFGCACEHEGVFDAIMSDTFDADAFQKENPDMKLQLELNKADDEDAGSEDEDDKGDEEKDKEDEGKKDDEEEDADSDEDKEGEDDSDDEEEDESKKSDDTATLDEDNSEDDAGSELDNAGLAKKVSALEKKVSDVTEMLERSLEMHDVAASALNETVALTFASLDMLMAMAETEDMEEDAKSVFTEINESIKSVREDVEKRGAKISTNRMAVLREISEKLAQLIDSVSGESKKGAKMKKGLDEIQKSFVEMKDELKEEIQSSATSIKEDVDSKLKSVNQKLEDIEQSGGASFGLDDDDTEEEVVVEQEKSESLFSDIIGMDDVVKNIEKKRRNLRK